MTTPTYVGHPDWQPSNSTPISVLIAEETGIAVGAWGPYTVNVSSSGAYNLSIQAVTQADVLLTDVTIKHLDIAGNTVHSDFFGAVMNGSGLSPGLQLPAPTILRGNIYGSQLVISGKIATSAQCNSILNTSGLVASVLDWYLYVLPNGLGDPEPRINSGLAELGSFTYSTPGGLLVSEIALAVALGTTSASFPLVPYSGPAALYLFESGLSTTPLNAQFHLNGYTVGGGNVPIYSQTYRTPADVTPYVFNIDLPQCLTILTIQNSDGAQALTATCNIIADKSA